MLSVESYPSGDGIVNVGTVRNRFGDIISVSTHYREYTKPVGDGGKGQKKESGDDSFWNRVGDTLADVETELAATAWQRAKGAGNFVKDWASDWRNWADAAVIATCAVGAVASGGIAAAACVPLTVGVIGGKFAEDVYSDGLGSGFQNLGYNAAFAMAGGGAGAAAGRIVSRKLVQKGIPTMRRGARHAVGKGSHRAVPTPTYRGAMAGVTTGTAVPPCGVALSYCP